MGVSDVMNTGRSGMVAAKTAIATAGHNITNSNAEGYSRQRVETETNETRQAPGRGRIGRGVMINNVTRVNDQYISKQLRNSQKEMANLEEKELLLNQVENVFNELDGEGLNRLVSRFFNEFRRLANDPDREALRESVRETSQSMVTDFKRLRSSVDDISRLIDSRLEGAAGDLNSLTRELRDINMKIVSQEQGGAPSNDLRDQRDELLRKITEYVDVSMHEDEAGNYVVNMKGVGPLVVGPNAEQFSVSRTPKDEDGKPENAYDLLSTAYAGNKVTHVLKGGRLGALLEIRDSQISKLQERLDEMAFSITNTVNQIHTQGVNRNGVQGIQFFKQLNNKTDASHFFDLADPIKQSLDNIATAAEASSPGDNRVALAIASLQSKSLMNDGQTTLDDYYNGMVSDVGVVRARNSERLSQQTNVVKQLDKMRENIAGVSVDEETANLLQFQHIFDASAKVIQVADDMLKTVLELKRN